MWHVQHNSTCKAEERDCAGEFVLELYIRDAVIFFQDMPFWYQKFPELPLWRIAALQPFWKGPAPVLIKWMNLQLQFVSAMESRLQELTIAFPLQSVTNCRAQLVNAYMMQLVGPPMNSTVFQMELASNILFLCCIRDAFYCLFAGSCARFKCK